MVCPLQMLAKCLMDCYDYSSSTDCPFSLKVFVSGRNRLENDGATALAAVFKVAISEISNCSPDVLVVTVAIWSV